jgi:hypothetical protein
MLRKLFSLGALVVVAVTFGVGSAAAAQSGNPGNSGKQGNGASFKQDGFSDGRMSGRSEGFSDGRS